MNFHWILRTSEDQNNPTLSGGVYGDYITIGKGVGYGYDGSQTRGIIFIADGGKYGLDSVSSVEYKGSILTAGTNWNFYRGTITKQIDPRTVTINVGANKVNDTGHPYNNGDPMRFRSVDGNLPSPLVETLQGQSQKVWVVNKTANDYQLSSTDPASATTLITLTNAGTGTIKSWKANAGFDDPEQGLSKFCPEVETTFNNIAYIDFKLPSGVSSSSNPPDWADFRILGTGRRLMDYDDVGDELGIIAGDPDQLSNAALVILDNLFTNYRVKHSRMDFESWFAMRQDADVEILQRVNTTETASVTGATGRYYQGSTGHPTYPTPYTQLVISRLDSSINIPDSLPNIPPAPGVDGYGFSSVWKFQLKPRYSELYTLTVEHDNSAVLIINGAEILNQTAVGTHTATFTFIADQLYDVELRFIQDYLFAGGNHYKCIFKWQSTSQALEVVPGSRMFPSDEIVKRYRINMAFNAAVEASEVHERAMERVPGWDWTDTGEKIVFLPPNREPVFTFEFDLIDDDSVANFTNKSFTKKRRPLSDRKNFQLFKFRNILDTGYPYLFVQADREELRRFTNGEPSNDPASDLGVMTQSLAQRMADMEMTLKSDPKHTATLDAALESSKLRKNQKVLVKYFDRFGNKVADEEYLITFNSFGASNNRNAFSLLPLQREFYVDEPVS